jgi:protein-disulfide isomerase
MKLAIGGLIAFCVTLIGVAVFFATRPNAPQARVIPMNEQYTKRVETGAWTKGAENAQVVVTEYADYQCPGCAAMASVVNEVLAKTDFVKFEFKNYPLAQHNKAKLAARAAESAGRQGKYWDMHNILFANQSTWENQSLTAFKDTVRSYAESLNLQMEQFNADLDDKVLDDLINQDISAGNKVPVTGTPTFVVNGKKLGTLPKTSDEFIALLEAARAE